MGIQKGYRPGREKAKIHFQKCYFMIFTDMVQRAATSMFAFRGLLGDILCANWNGKLALCKEHVSVPKTDRGIVLSQLEFGNWRWRKVCFFRLCFHASRSWRCSPRGVAHLREEAESSRDVKLHHHSAD